MEKCLKMVDEKSQIGVDEQVCNEHQMCVCSLAMHVLLNTFEHKLTLCVLLYTKCYKRCFTLAALNIDAGASQ